MRWLVLAFLLALAACSSGQEEGEGCVSTNQCAEGLLCFSECLAPPCPEGQCHRLCTVNSDCPPTHWCDRYCKPTN